MAIARWAVTGSSPRISLGIAWAAVLAAVALPATARGQEGTLQTIRDDVRQGPAPEPASPSEVPRYDNRTASSDTDPSWDPTALLGAAWGAAIVAASPIWVPQQLLDDHFPQPGFLLRYPYDHSDGYLKMYEGCPWARPWAVRLDAEYLDTFDRLDNVSGHLLVSTAWRFGLDASASRLQERLGDGRRDEVALGDCNLVYRFAQNEWAEFRAGLGANWLNDACRTDLGFNFTYSADLFPKKPWVLSAALDAGTLGHAGLFRFRTTAGIVLNRVEFYTGYEYTDIQRTHWNALVGGVRLWF